ncbi:MAG: sucrose synthase [Ignavibacteriaceae bacterium]
MSNNVKHLIEENKKDFFSFLNRVSSQESKLMIKGKLFEVLEDFKKDNNNGSLNAIEQIVGKTTESIQIGNIIYLEIREKIASPDFYLFNIEELYYEQITVHEFLTAKERFISPNSADNLLTLNFSTFYDKFPSIKEQKHIGIGVEYLNRYLSSNMFMQPEKLSKALFRFLFLHKYKAQQLILNDRVISPELLSSSIDTALKFLKKKPEDEPYKEFVHELQQMGFEPGLGNTAGKIVESLEMLEGLLQFPDHDTLKEFLSRIPMIFNIAIISPHGYFGQEGVLGLPDTGGQVVYILDQVKALEKKIILSLEESGLDAKPKIIILTRFIPNAGSTMSSQRLEKVHETKDSWILRVPFRTHNKNVTDNWISRFEVWPYLEDFAEDSYKELLAEFSGRPDFIIGNYSDGNMVAYILAKRLGVTQCNIAHALEKSKYLFGALYWKDLEQFYNFSVQFTADLITMNAANFIVTSTYQEIAGTEDNIGQYESYQYFSLPDLYRVEGGINLHHPKFNIVPPGVNTKIFFPFTQNEDRIKEVNNELNQLLFENINDAEVFGKLEQPDLIPIFSLARLDKIKNITGLVNWYGENPELQKESNLIIVAGKIDADKSSDGEEKEQINWMYHLIDQYKLQNKIRWIGKLLRKDQTGEVYRLIADKRGIFVQPALFEGFGLTVLEAMRSGLPVFATKYGGPLEIIQDNVSGFHIDPAKGNESSVRILDFILRCKKEPAYWDKISSKAIERVDKAYNWELYANNLLSLAKIYGFWKYTTNIEMEEMNSYLDVLYHLLYKPRANAILENHNRR